MGRKLHLLLLGLCVLAFAGGFAAKRMVTAPDRHRLAAEGEAAATDQRKSGARTEGSGQPDVAPATPTLRSSDTLEELLGIDDDLLYPRLALWLLDASAEEVAAFWEVYAKRENRRTDLTDLIFVGWTRLNPQAATAAVEGTEDEWSAWRAWACNDPEAALAASLVRKPQILGKMVWGIAEFHPDWLIEHFDKIPAEGRQSALHGLSHWATAEDPEAMLEFLRSHGARIPEELVGTLLQRDPWAAVEWLEATGGRLSSRHLTERIETLAEYHPEVLDALLEQEPPGARRRAMERELFTRRLETDLEGALEVARATQGARVAGERLGMVGAKLVRSDPERAFEILGEIAALDYDPFRRSTRVRHPGAHPDSGVLPPDEIEELVNGLVAEDAERLLGMGLWPETGIDGQPGPLWESWIASLWASHRVEDYATWVATQEPGEDREWHSHHVAHQLGQQERFGESMEWARSLNEGPRRTVSVLNALRDWAARDRQAAVEWFKGADLTDAERESCLRHLPEVSEGEPISGTEPNAR